MDTIINPSNPQHYMTFELVEGRMVARVGETVIASSERAVRVTETMGSRGSATYVYFPRGDVHDELLEPMDKQTFCPLKGTCSYFHVGRGDAQLTESAWSYQSVLDFDERLSKLESCVAFYPNRVSVELLKG